MTDDYVRVFKGEYGSYLRYPKNNNDDILAGLSYLTWIVSLVVLLGVKPLSPYLRFHAIQGLGLMITNVVLASLMAATLIFFIGFCLLPFFMALSVYTLVVMIIVLTGKDHRVPYLADYIEKNYI